MLCVCVWLKRYIDSIYHHTANTIHIINWLSSAHIVLMCSAYSCVLLLHCVCISGTLAVCPLFFCCGMLRSKWFRNSWMAFLIWFEQLISKKSRSLLFYIKMVFFSAFTGKKGGGLGRKGFGIGNRLTEFNGQRANQRSKRNRYSIERNVYNQILKFICLSQ